MKNNTKKTSIPSYWLLILVLIVIGVGIVGFKEFRRNTPAKPQSGAAVPSIKPAAKGKMRLLTQGNKKVFTVNEEIVVLLYGDSAGQEVAGYDAMFELEKGVTFVRAESVIQELTIKTSQKEALSITGMIGLDANLNGVVLNDVPLALLVFKKSTPGMLNLKLSFTKGETNDSNIVRLSPPEDMLETVENLEVYIGKKAGVAKPVAIGEGITFKLDEAITPEPDCNDCQTTVRADVTKGLQTKKLEFLLGGIDGQTAASADAFGYIFELHEGAQGSSEVYFAPRTADNESS